MNTEKIMPKRLSALGAWSFAIGTSVGWGSLVVTSSTYLAQAGPMGSVLGLIIGALVMFVICRNYTYMMKCYPDAGGVYTFAREVFGYDQGFLISWFAAMTYFAMFWANATSLPLFGRIFLGGMFHVGRMYSLFGYEVYLGEALLSLAAIALTGLLCMKSSRWADRIMTGMALLFSGGIVICFVAALLGPHPSMSPAFTGDTSALRQTLRIAIISPWAFIGFESISHRTGEFAFDRGRIHSVLVISVISTAVLYCFVTLLSVSAYPPRFSGWLQYITSLDSLEGIEGLPAFYAANRYLGDFGVYLLMLSLLALVFTSLIGNITALSRLLYSMAKDRILPARLAQISDSGIPSNAVLAIVLFSAFIPFIGRTAIGWIVDVTTIGAVLIYGFVSAAAAALAKKMGDRRELWTGRTGLVIMLLLGANFLLPNLIMRGSLATETYFLFIIWSVLGFVFFRSILRRDTKKRFGTSITVWVAFLAFVLIISLIWMRQSMITSYDSMIENVEGYYEETAERNSFSQEDAMFIDNQLTLLEDIDTRTMIMAVGMFGFALLIMLTNHSYMNKRSRESEMLANRDPLTGVMSKHAYLIREKELDSQIEDGDQREFGIVVCDVNGLKKINDTLGHKAGDEYIRKACAMVCEIFAHSPVFRVGGDEFTAILVGRDFAAREELMTMLHDRSAEHIGTQEAVVSGGMAVYRPGEDRHVQDVFQRADARMYEEKKVLKSLGAVTRDDESDAEQAAKEAAEEAEKAAQEPILSIRRHVLIVEDEVINQEMLGHILEDEFDLYYASDGEEALEILRDHTNEIAIVLLDLMMPLMSGLDLLRIMHNDAGLRSIPVIVLTADQDAELECLRLGAMDFISKPYPIWEVVRARIDKCIELSENRGIIRSTERDSLTKLLNIDYFYRYVELFDRHYADQPMDALVLDVNHFHLINERYGKNYGDAVLARIGECVRRISREVGGVGCRQGADTFLLYCPHREDYAQLLERICEEVCMEAAENGNGGGEADGRHTRFSFAGGKHDREGAAGGKQDRSGAAGEGVNRIRMRLGVYAQVDKTMEIERRFDRARTAADAARSAFSGPVGIYDEHMGETALLKERLLESFHSSIRQKYFVVCYQPRFDIRPDRPVISGAEALVRWDHPDIGLIPPSQFIPLLEENGLILELDQYVWRETAAQIRRWKDEFGFSIPVSVNVSRRDMLMPDLPGVLREILETYRLGPEDLILEVTESAYTGDSEQVISTARALGELGMGLRIEMDDFGSGYSSLGMLSSLPIDALKLDMTFIHNAFDEARNMRMIKLVLDIAQHLQVPVVAEGVETQEQYQALREMGCDFAQGFYFSKPASAEELRELMGQKL